MKITKTYRGFNIGSFLDRNGQECSLQESSVCCTDEEEGSYIWLGVDDANPQVLARDAHKVGVKTSEDCGWIPYPVPEEVLLHTRMHLSQRQVKELLPLLQHFAETGSLPE